MNGKGRWSERERGSRDRRLLPVTVLSWSASLLTHAAFSMMTANGTHVGPALIAIILLMAVVAGVGLASLRLRGPSAAKLMSWHSGAMVCIAAVLACSCTALTYDLVQWNDVSSSLARKGTTPVTVRLHVVSPTVASNRRANDCQADAVLQTVTEGQLVRASASRIRVYADQPDCAMLRQDGTYQLDGMLMPSDYGSMPIWLTDVDDIRMIRAPNAVFRLVDVMQRSFFIQTGRLSDQGKVLVPGLTLGILGQDYVPTEDSTDGSGIDATYAGRLEDDFRKSGILHLMAVSGGHLAVVATLVRTICAFFVIPRRITAILIGLSYIALSCCMFPSDSVFRALLMGLAGATCLFLGRRGQALSTLCWTAMGVLLIQPYMSYSFGFALSCAAVLGIVLFADRMTDWLKAMLPLFVAQAAGMTIAAQLFTLPLQVLIEPELPVFSILANLVVSPVVGFSTLAGLASLALSWILPDIGFVLAWLSGCGTAIMEIVSLHLGSGNHATIPWAGGIPGAMLVLAVESVCACSIWLMRRIARRAGTPEQGMPGRRMLINPMDRLRLWGTLTFAALKNMHWDAD